MARDSGLGLCILKVLKRADTPLAAYHIARRMEAAGYEANGAGIDLIAKRVRVWLSSNRDRLVRPGWGKWELPPGGWRPSAPPPTAAAIRDHPLLGTPEPPRVRGTAIRLEAGECERAARDLMATFDRDATEAAEWHLRTARYHLLAYAALKSREHETRT